MKLILSGQKVMCSELFETATDSVERVQINFVRGQDWENLDITAQFTQGNKTYSVHPDENDCCYLPAEIGVGEYYISAFGVLGATRLTTFPFKATANKSGFVGDGETPIPPTPDLYQQIIAEMRSPAYVADAENAAKSANEAAVRADKAAESAEKAAQAAAHAAGAISETVEELMKRTEPLAYVTEVPDNESRLFGIPPAWTDPERKLGFYSQIDIGDITMRNWLIDLINREIQKYHTQS